MLYKDAEANYNKLSKQFNTWIDEITGKPVIELVIDGETQEHEVERIMYSLAYGECPEGVDVVHTCGDILCMDPSHLALVQ
jgi:hypothetical protein